MIWGECGLVIVEWRRSCGGAPRPLTRHTPLASLASLSSPKGAGIALLGSRLRIGVRGRAVRERRGLCEGGGRRQGSPLRCGQGRVTFRFVRLDQVHEQIEFVAFRGVSRRVKDLINAVHCRLIVSSVLINFVNMVA